MSEMQNGTNSSRLQYFPVMMFAVIMGFSGITLAYKKACEVFLLPEIIYQTLSYITALIAVIISLIYIVKLIRYPNEVKKEIQHPVRVNFFAAISISMLLQSTVFHEYENIAFPLFVIGTGLQTFFTFYTITYWFNKNIELAHSNPAWFIPVVGNIIVPIAGDGFTDIYLLDFFFSLGIFFWIILTAILFNRIIFHGMLAQKFLPTLAIFIAPPSVGMLSYLKLQGAYDMFAVILFNVALTFGLILLALIKNFYKIEFFISWWAFTFPMAALTMAIITVYEKTSFEYLTLKLLGYASLIMTSVVIFIVLICTITAIKNGEICINES
ncbi:MAG: SLAC1 anion channel family protein [Mucispirillum sp.]|nr:SLAC1 anion channel family protein [Mucispirillum sp.]